MFNSKSYSCLLILIITIIILQDVDESESRTKKTPGIFYILQWIKQGDPYTWPHYLQRQNYFKISGCEYQNCFVTNQIDYLGNVLDFDAVLFYALYSDCVINGIGVNDIPQARADNQIYVFISMESATNCPASARFNFFFNYTWTYKLTSDIPNLFVSVRNRTSGEVIGPKKDMQWIDVKDMEPTELSIIKILETKKFAAAWFVSNCKAKSGRSIYVNNLQTNLSHRNNTLHIYGRCGKMDCPKEKLDECLMKIERDYYFYVSFENSFAEDYVTEKVLWGLQNYAVPIVFGSANYSRFMPDGIYLNAYGMNESALAEKMSELMENKSKYYDFFKWHRYYSFHSPYESAETNELCVFCAFLNGNWSQERRVYARFTEWWNEDEHKVPRPKTQDTIFYFDKPSMSRKPYIHYYPRKNKKETRKNKKETKCTANCWSEFFKNMYNYIARALSVFNKLG